MPYWRNTLRAAAQKKAYQKTTLQCVEELSRQLGILDSIEFDPRLDYCWLRLENQDIIVSLKEMKALLTTCVQMGFTASQTLLFLREKIPSQYGTGRQVAHMFRAQNGIGNSYSHPVWLTSPPEGQQNLRPGPELSSSGQTAYRQTATCMTVMQQNSAQPTSTNTSRDSNGYAAEQSNQAQTASRSTRESTANIVQQETDALRRLELLHLRSEFPGQWETDIPF